jgi:hypothetical protein
LVEYVHTLRSYTPVHVPPAPSPIDTMTLSEFGRAKVGFRLQPTWYASSGCASGALSCSCHPNYTYASTARCPPHPMQLAASHLIRELRPCVWCLGLLRPREVLLHQIKKGIIGRRRDPWVTDLHRDGARRRGPSSDDCGNGVFLCVCVGGGGKEG